MNRLAGFITHAEYPGYVLSHTKIPVIIILHAKLGLKIKLILNWRKTGKNDKSHTEDIGKETLFFLNKSRKKIYYGRYIVIRKILA